MNPYQKVASNMVARKRRDITPFMPIDPKRLHYPSPRMAPRPKMKFPTFPARPAPRPNGKLWT